MCELNMKTRIYAAPVVKGLMRIYPSNCLTCLKVK